jgi:hypothetical protein
MLILAFLPISLLWILSRLRTWVWGNPLCFLLFLLSAAASTWLAIHPFVPLVAVTAALIAWDMNIWNSVIKDTQRVDWEKRPVRNHIRRLGVVIAIGFILSSVALTLSFEIPFTWALLLGLILTIALSRTVSFLRHPVGK